MRYPWANTLLLVLIVAQAVTGLFGLVSGSSDRAVYLQAHRIAAYATLALLLWKGRIVVHALRSPRRMAPIRWLWVLNALLLITVLALGVAWALWGPFYFLGFSGMSWHVYLGVALVPLMVYHAIMQVSGFPLRYWVERRSASDSWVFQRSAFFSGGSPNGVPTPLAFTGAKRRFTGSYLRGTQPGNSFPTVSWLNDRPQSIDPSTWTLQIEGHARQPFNLSYDWLAEREETLEATLDCTGGWYTTQTWEGVSMAKLLDMAGVGPDASSITVTSVTGYYRRFSLDEARHYILATRVGGQTLTHGHGFPTRLVAVGHRGYNWVKWVTVIRVNDTSKYWQPPLPLQ